MGDDEKKPSRKKIVSEVAEKFTAHTGEVVGADADHYLGDSLDLDAFIRSATPDYRIEGVAELLRYHFLRTGLPTDAESRQDAEPLTGDAHSEGPGQKAIETTRGVAVGVRDFVSLLPHRLQRLDSGNATKLESRRGRTGGPVDWRRTSAQRARAGGAAEQVFVTKVPDTEALSDRNRVLLWLLSQLREIAEEFDRTIRSKDHEGPGWLSNWAPDGDLRQTVVSALENNPHLADTDARNIDVTDKMVYAAGRDKRVQLYREAGALAEQLRSLGSEQLDQETVENLFELDVFEPDGKSGKSEGADVFELYWILELLDTAPTQHLSRFSLGGDQVLSRWTEDESQYLLCHDTYGSVDPGGGAGEQKLVDVRDPRHWDHGGEPDEPSNRRGHARQYTVDLVRESGLKPQPQPKRPDILLVELDAAADDHVVERVFIGEVKHSTKNGTLGDGMEQLLQYGAFARVGEDARPAGDERHLGDSEFLSSDRIELGLFVGHDDCVERVDRPNVQVRGWTADPDRPLEPR